MKIRIAALSTGAAAIVATALYAQAPEEAPAVATASTAAASWAKVYEVFSHPRCANCHVPEDGRPRWSGASYGLAEGEWTYHAMNIHGGQSRIGLESIPCSTCHTAENSETPHGPPGNPVWMLPPVEMTWWGKTSQEICEQIKDPARNGGRSLEDVADHVAHDELVHWGWEPGPGREPAPYSAAEISAALVDWAGAGAPCPNDAE